jgi:Predicted RNA-binding protein containing KH domain, possibly ribosomal protein
MTSKQRAYLRSLANTIQATFQIGKNGINDDFVKQIDDFLEANELVKISVLDTASEPNSALADELSILTTSVIVQIIGNKITLYRKSSKKPKITLPNK